MLQVNNLKITLTNELGNFLAVNNVSLTLAQGEIADIVGQSGAGKSTLMSALALLTPHESGTIHLDGLNSQSINPRVWRTKVALVQQKPSLTEKTVRDELLLPFTLKIRKDVARPSEKELRAYLDSAGLEEIDLSRSIYKLSLGQQARIAFLRTAITHPKVLLLDETDASLDPKSAEMIRALIKLFSQEGGAVLRVRHKPDDGLATRRIVMEKGEIIADSVQVKNT